MNAQDLRAAKREMEEAIRLAVSTAILQFNLNTGLSPHAIRVSMKVTTHPDGKLLRYDVEDVRTDVSL